MMAVDAKGSSPWLQPPNPLERPLKAGWLKKQRSIVKNWQQRYFVLKGQQLYYYKEEEDLKPQGSLQLQGCTIREVASGSDEAGKFIFEIIPGLSADQTRTGPDSFVLMANSQADMEEWVKLLRRVVGSPLGVVFGQQLGDTMMYEQRFGQHQVPILVEKCAEFIRKNGLMEEGVFRLPGQDNLGHPQLVKQLAHLPQDNYNLLSYICRFLHEVQQSSDTNKMSVENLATVFGIQKVMTTMISDHEKLFPAARDARPPSPPSESSSKKAPVLRSSVGWDAVQRPSMAWKENRSLLQIKDDLEASSSELSDGLALSAEDKEEPQSRDALVTGTARKRTQTLPNRKCFESFSSNRRNQNMDRTDIFSSNFWSSSSSSSMVHPSPNSPSGSHKRTLPQGISKLFGFTQASDSGSLRSLGQSPTREADNSSSGQLREEFGPCLQMNDPPRSKENGTTILELSFEEDNLYPEDPELLRKMIAELKQELMAQKNTHEEQIRR
ncbi:hypothetical protein Chor_002155 [Crotalus horridus]